MCVCVHMCILPGAGDGLYLHWVLPVASAIAVTKILVSGLRSEKPLAF